MVACLCSGCIAFFKDPSIIRDSIILSLRHVSRSGLVVFLPKGSSAEYDCVVLCLSHWSLSLLV
jgi:hypothetical protein